VGGSLKAVAVSFGSVLVISSTSCCTIIFSVTLTTLLLKEQFIWKKDGVTVLILSIGVMMAAS